MRLSSEGGAASTVKPEDHVPFRQKVSYAVGSSVEFFSIGSIYPMWMPVFNLGFGIGPGLLGMVGVIHRIWDAIFDPFIGNLSDNTRTRWGRRRPYIVIGSLLLALFTPLTWRLSPQWSEMQMLIYITLIGLLVHTSYSLWAMPFNSLMLEMTPSYDERTRISAYRTIMMKFGVLVGAWVLPLASSKLFAKPDGAPDMVHGIQVISLIFAALTILVGLQPAVFVPERYYAKEASRQAKEPFIKGIRDSLSLKPLWMLLGVVLFQVMGNTLVGGMGFYINMFYINKGQLASAAFIEGLKGSTAFVVGLLAVPFWTWVCEKLDKKWTLMIIIGSGFISSALNFVCFTPAHPYLQIVPAVFYASVTASIWLLLPSMLADVVDCDELRTFRRREGNINAVFSWIFKFGTTLAAGLSGFILEWTGFEAKNGAQQPQEVLRRMLILFIVIPVISYTIALVILWFYPLHRRKMAGVRAELEARRGKI